MCVWDRAGRLLGMLALVAGAHLALPAAAGADANDPQVIDSEVLHTAALLPASENGGLLIQATSWALADYRYILTFSNTSSWPIDYLHVLDRYLSGDPAQQEVISEWAAGRFEPGQTASWAMTRGQGAFENGCHQLEMIWSDGWSAILMDCSQPPATTLWEIPLSEVMAVYPQSPALTAVLPVGPSKAGLHVTRNASPLILEYVKAAQPAVVVSIDDFSWLEEVKRVSPKTVTLGRMIEKEQTMAGDPAEAARAFVTLRAGKYLANPAVDFWLGWNEPGVSQPWEMAWYAAFEAERVVALSELGLKAAVGNFSTGTPEADRFLDFIPALQATRQHGGILALHEYSAPTLSDGVEAGIPGLEGAGGRGALTLRYRYWYDHYLRARNLALPLVITEAGIDGGVLREQKAILKGFRDFDIAMYGPEDSPTPSADSYIQQLSWYDDELRRDPYVLGFAIFNVGDTTGEWASFDITDDLDRLRDMSLGKQ